METKTFAWETMTFDEAERNVREMNETYNFSENYKNAEEAAANVRTGYENDPDWFSFTVSDLDKFEDELVTIIGGLYFNEEDEIRTLEDLAECYNESEDLDPFYFEEVIKNAGWVSDCHEEYGLAHSKTQKCIINERGVAEVVDMTTAEKVTTALRDGRDKAGLTIAQLSEKRGINASNLSRIERGQVSPNLDTLSTIAEALGLQFRLE